MESDLKRPTGFDQGLADEVLNRLAEGELLSKICVDGHLPTARQFRYWLTINERLATAYARARLSWADTWAERIMDISFNPQGGVIDASGNPVLDHATIALLKLQTDNAKWLVGKWAPRTYGDRPQEDAGDSKQLTITWEARDPLPPPPPPKQIAFDPGPLPSRMDGEIVTQLVRLIKDNVPRAADREPMTVLSEVMSVIERALIAEYGTKPATPPRLRKRGPRHVSPT
jgi:hypothetical protein